MIIISTNDYDEPCWFCRSFTIRKENLNMESSPNEWDVGSEEDLNALVENHQSLLPGDRIVGIVDAIPAQFKDYLQTLFLQGVVYYHLQHKSNVPDWQGAYDRFVDVTQCNSYPPGNPLLMFYIHNYCYLSLRNANGNQTTLYLHYKAAKEAVEQVAEPLQSQLLGFLEYNNSRWYLKNGFKVEALPHYQAAVAARIRWYTHVRDHKQGLKTIQAAATQVWKCRNDFPTFFPETPLEACGISDELFEEIMPLAGPKFSAAKPA